MISGGITFNMLFKRGDTTTINLTLEEPLTTNLKIGLFDERSRMIWSIVLSPTYITDTSVIWDSSRLNCLIKLDHNITKELIGNVTLRVTMFNNDGSYVNSGEQIMTLRFVDEPINRNLY